MFSRAFIKEYFKEMKYIHEIFLDFLQSEDSERSQLQKINKYFDEQNIRQNKSKLKLILHLISKISNHYHRSSDSINKIEKILKILKNDIISKFKNSHIFNIFKSNKRILLFLFEEKILIPNKYLSTILMKKEYKDRSYHQYFYKEFEPFFDETFCDEITSNNPEVNEFDSETFLQKRRKGENDRKICQIIQNDSIDEFVNFTNENNFSLSSIIEPSIYETNSFLLKNNPSLIEYSAFCGSIQILNYLYKNEIELKPSLWLYAIHSQNMELIHLLEEKHVEPPKNECYNESIKCHHVSIVNYIKSNFFNKKNENEEEEIDDDCCFFHQSLEFYNFIDLCNNENAIDDSEISFLFYFFCKNDYIDIVNFLLKDEELKMNSRIILKLFFFKSSSKIKCNLLHFKLIYVLMMFIVFF